MAHELIGEARIEAGHPGADRDVKVTRAVLTDLFGPPEARGFAVRLWDGSIQPAGASPFAMSIASPGALRRMFLPPTETRLAEAYLRGDFDVEGDPEAASGLAEALAPHSFSAARLAGILLRLLILPRDAPARADPIVPSYQARGLPHSRARDARAVRFHYDAGNDFFSLWLDRRMTYSCAYFPTGREDRDAAQEAKLEHICRKLRLRRGERLLDVGCGWGGLVIYAAERHGVDALGITLSEPQAELARGRIASAGLAGRCRVEVRDYRELPREPTFDKAVSVGMVEHVGRARLPEYFRAVRRALVPGGLFLNHGIVAPRLHARPGGGFIASHVFPDGDLVPLDVVLRAAEPAGFEVRDVENLREHYARTLRHWVGRLERRHADAARLVGEATYRMWRLYLAGSARALARGRLGVVQALLASPAADGSSAVPPTRADPYAGARAA